MGGMDNRTGNGFAKDRRAGAHRARSFYKGCYEAFLADPSAQYLMTFSEYKRKWGKEKKESQICSVVAGAKRKIENRSKRRRSSQGM